MLACSTNHSQVWFQYNFLCASGRSVAPYCSLFVTLRSLWRGCCSCSGRIFMLAGALYKCGAVCVRHQRCFHFHNTFNTTPHIFLTTVVGPENRFFFGVENSAEL